MKLCVTPQSAVNALQVITAVAMMKGRCPRSAQRAMGYAENRIEQREGQARHDPQLPVGQLEVGFYGLGQNIYDLTIQKAQHVGHHQNDHGVAGVSGADRLQGAGQGFVGVRRPKMRTQIASLSELSTALAAPQVRDGGPSLRRPDWGMPALLFRQQPKAAQTALRVLIRRAAT